MMNDIKVSVITVSFNNLVGLQRTASSVFAQRGEGIEFIIVDGGSEDGTLAYLQEHQAALAWWCSEADAGIFPAMNKGVEHARGKYCIFMNAGDEFYDPNVLSRTLPYLTDKDFYMGHQQNYGNNNRRLYAPACITFGNIAITALAHQATFIRTELLRQRPYDVSFPLIADWKQMLEEFVFYNATYEALPFFVSRYDTSGVSHQKKYAQQYEQERQRMYQMLFPPRLVQELNGYDSLDRKVRRALTNRNPVTRDLKILRNIIKYLPVDLWHRWMGK